MVPDEASSTATSAVARPPDTSALQIRRALIEFLLSNGPLREPPKTGSRGRWFRAIEHIPRDALRHKGSVTRQTSIGFAAFILDSVERSWICASINFINSHRRGACSPAGLRPGFLSLSGGYILLQSAGNGRYPSLAEVRPLRGLSRVGPWRHGHRLRSHRPTDRPPPRHQDHQLPILHHQRGIHRPARPPVSRSTLGRRAFAPWNRGDL